MWKPNKEIFDKSVPIEPERKVHYIDVGDMSVKDVCTLLGIKHTPWHKDLMFWALILIWLPSIIMLMKGC